MDDETPKFRDSERLGDVPGGLVEALAGSRRVLVTAHVNADGDAVGSTVALVRGLRTLGKTARGLLSDLPQKYASLNVDDAVFVAAEPPASSFYDDWDLGVLLDAAQPQRSGPLHERFFEGKFPLLCIDHHKGDPAPCFAQTYIDTRAAATGTLVLRVLDALEVSLDRELAEALFVAIATDTGWFRHANTRPVDLRDAARLVEFGLEPEAIYNRLYESLSLERVKLGGEIVARLRVEHGGQYVWSHVDAGLLASSGVDRSELEGLIDALRTVEGSEVTALLTQAENGSWKVSLRSRGAVDVAAVAQAFGGGGHARAAGGRLEGSLETVSRSLTERVGLALEASRPESRRTSAQPGAAAQSPAKG